MKWIGYTFIAIGLAIAVYVGYVYFTQDEEIVSPVPDETGIRVIYVTPGASDTDTEGPDAPEPDN